MGIRTVEESFSGYDPRPPAEPSGFSGIQPQEVAAQAIGQVKEKAGQAAETAREVVKGQVETRTSEAGGQVSSIASDLRRAAESLRSEGSSGVVANMAEKAADTVEQAAGYLDSADLETLLDDVKRLGKERPLAVAGGLFALGFAASRLIRISAGTGEE